MKSFNSPLNEYSSKTLVGNWQENRSREEDKRLEFISKCESNSLVIQKMAILQETFLDYMLTTESTDEFLRWQNSVGLVCPPPKAHLVDQNHSLARPRTLICVDLDESLIYRSMKFTEGVAIGATVIIKPTARSIFQIISPQGCPPECKVTFGAHLQLKLASDKVSDGPLYMASDFINTAGGNNRLSGNRKVFLSFDHCAYNTYWQLEHIDPRIRLEMKGEPVLVNYPVIIRHCKTNSALAVEPYTRNGFFGREYEVSTHDHLDDHRSESNCNYFCFCTNLDVCEEQKDKCLME